VRMKNMMRRKLVLSFTSFISSPFVQATPDRQANLSLVKSLHLPLTSLKKPYNQSACFSPFFVLVDRMSWQGSRLADKSYIVIPGGIRQKGRIP